MRSLLLPSYFIFLHLSCHIHAHAFSFLMTESGLVLVKFRWVLERSEGFSFYHIRVSSFNTIYTFFVTTFSATGGVLAGLHFYLSIIICAYIYCIIPYIISCSETAVFIFYSVMKEHLKYWQPSLRMRNNDTTIILYIVSQTTV